MCVKVRGTLSRELQIRSLQTEWNDDIMSRKRCILKLPSCNSNVPLKIKIGAASLPLFDVSFRFIVIAAFEN